MKAAISLNNEPVYKNSFHSAINTVRLKLGTYQKPSAFYYFVETVATNFDLQAQKHIGGKFTKAMRRIRFAEKNLLILNAKASA